MPSPSVSDGPDSSSPLRLTRHARFSLSGTSVGFSPSSSMANDEVLARLDALFLDVKKRREEDLRKKYSHLDSRKGSSGGSEARRSSGTAGYGERRTSGTAGPADRRTSGSNALGDHRTSGLSSTLGRKGSADSRRWSASVDRPSVNGADYKGSYDSLNRRRSSSSTTGPQKANVGGSSVPRRGSQTGTNEPVVLRRGSGTTSKNSPKRWSLNGIVNNDHMRRLYTPSDAVDGDRIVNDGPRKGSFPKERSPADHNGFVLRRDPPVNRGYRRDSLDVEKVMGNRRQSYYDTSILEEDENPVLGSSGGGRVRPFQFSPPPNASVSPRESPGRSSPSRSSPSRSSPSRTTPSRSTPPRPLSFGRIRRQSDIDPGPLDRLFENRDEGSQGRRSSSNSVSSLKSALKDGEGKPRFLAVTRLEDLQAVRCAEFHPSGQFYAVGSNSKMLRICAYPKLNDLREDHSTYQPTVLFKRTKHHKGSIYCLGWSPDGDLIATGSNDKTLKLMRFNQDSCTIEGQEIELTMHDGTVRDICFIEDSSNKSSLLISGGAGDCKIYVTDCVTGTPFQALSGHTGHILALHTWGGAMFVSGSQDRTVRFWDLRTRGCVNVITPGSTPTKPGAPVASACVDPSGRLLVSGHEDSVCSLYDIRGSRTIQAFRPHSSDVRSIRFSPSAYYLLTAGYDNKLILTDLQGDLTLPLPSVVVGEHSDKAISGRWHPTDFSFISTSADKSCVLWALPPV